MFRVTWAIGLCVLGCGVAACAEESRADARDAELGNDAGVASDAQVATDGHVHADAQGHDGNRDAGSDEAAVAVECTVTAPTSCPEPPVRYADVAPIFKQRCQVCHAPDWSGPWPFDSYEHAAEWDDSIRAHLLDCTMPPPDAGMPLPNEESTRILTWVRCGAPE